MSWALAIKSKLGNVYHFVADDGVYARCDGRLRVEDEHYTEPRDDGYVCNRCRKIRALSSDVPPL